MRLILKQLNYFSEGDYFKKLIEDNNSEFNQVYKIMRKNFPTKKIFSDKHLLKTKIRIQDILKPVQGLNVNYNEYNKSILKLDISNLQRLPIEIIGLKLKDGTELKFEKRIIVKGKKALKLQIKFLLN